LRGNPAKVVVWTLDSSNHRELGGAVKGGIESSVDLDGFPIADAVNIPASKNSLPADRFAGFPPMVPSRPRGRVTSSSLERGGLTPLFRAYVGRKAASGRRTPKPERILREHHQEP